MVGRSRGWDRPYFIFIHQNQQEMSIQKIVLREEDFKDTRYDNVVDCPMARGAKRDLEHQNLCVEPYNVTLFGEPPLPYLDLPVRSVTINGNFHLSGKYNQSVFDEEAYNKCKALIDTGRFESCVIEVEQS